MKYVLRFYLRLMRGPLGSALRFVIGPLRATFYLVGRPFRTILYAPISPAYSSSFFAFYGHGALHRLGADRKGVIGRDRFAQKNDRKDHGHCDHDAD